MWQSALIDGCGGRMLRVTGLLFGLLLALILIPFPALAEKRIALLIGNQAYDRSVGVLRNPHNDIELVARALEKQGFEILPLLRDARRSAILGAVRELTRRLSAAGPRTIGFLYYSGHGAAEKDTNINYLIPIDARDPGTTTFWDDSVKLDDIMCPLDGARGALKFVVFDACRNELQLPTRDTSKGLVPVPEQQGYFVAYASAPGRTASDRGERSGPYAAALAAELGRQGLDHLNLFQNVKETVISTTGGAQLPWESNGLSRRVYLTGEPTTPADLALWESVRNSNDVTAMQRYLERFPNGVFAATAHQMINRLNVEAEQAAALQAALDDARKAREALDRQRADADVAVAQARSSVAAALAERNAATAREEELRKAQQKLLAEAATTKQSKLERADAAADLESKLESITAEVRATRQALATAEAKQKVAELAADEARARAAKPSLPPNPRTSAFDGNWLAILKCPAWAGGKSYGLQFDVRVENSILRGERGVKGKPDSRTLDGKIRSDGSASIRERGLTGATAFTGIAPGTLFDLGLSGQFDGEHGNAKRTFGRPCTYEFTKQ